MAPPFLVLSLSKQSSHQVEHDSFVECFDRVGGDLLKERERPERLDSF